MAQLGPRASAGRMAALVGATLVGWFAMYLLAVQVVTESMQRPLFATDSERLVLAFTFGGACLLAGVLVWLAVRGTVEDPA